MKLLVRLALPIAFVALIISHEYSVRSLRRAVETQKATIKTQENLIAILRSQPKPAVEVIVSTMQKNGYTNVTSLVFGRKDGFNMGCMVVSNDITAIGEVSFQGEKPFAPVVSKKL